MHCLGVVWFSKPHRHPAECVSASPPLSRCPQIDVARATAITRNMLSKLYFDVPACRLC
jgi:hypothetical protein